jgi:hypothetical protein
MVTDAFHFYYSQNKQNKCTYLYKNSFQGSVLCGSDYVVAGMFKRYVIAYPQIVVTYHLMKANDFALYWKWMKSGYFVAGVTRRGWSLELQ